MSKQVFVVVHKYWLVPPQRQTNPNIPKVVSTPVLYTPRVNLVAATVGLVWLTNAALKESGGNAPQTQVQSALHSAQISLAKNEPSALSYTIERAATFRPQTPEFLGCFFRTDYLKSHRLRTEARVC